MPRIEIPDPEIHDDLPDQYPQFEKIKSDKKSREEFASYERHKKLRRKNRQKNPEKYSNHHQQETQQNIEISGILLLTSQASRRRILRLLNHKNISIEDNDQMFALLQSELNKDTFLELSCKIYDLIKSNRKNEALIYGAALLDIKEHIDASLQNDLSQILLQLSFAGLDVDNFVAAKKFGLKALEI